MLYWGMLDPSYIFLLGRILFGGYFVAKGLSHLFMRKPISTMVAQSGVAHPSLFVSLSGVFVVVGGLGTLFGAFVTEALWLLIIFLIVVSFNLHKFWEVSESAFRLPELVNFTKNMALLGAAFMLLSVPEPWPFSLGWEL